MCARVPLKYPGHYDRAQATIPNLHVGSVSHCVMHSSVQPQDKASNEKDSLSTEESTCTCTPKM